VSATRIRIEVVFALPERQVTRTLTLPEGSTVADAVLASDLAREFPQIDTSRVGVFGKRVRPDTRLHDRERVEIYRLLQADPKELRRRRAKG
jgi:putative ubiquitin-RnfH superfamily antitoxin RatB of RatAB toxin-antitoxin module